MNNKTLVDNLRCIPDFPQKGINFRDVTTLFKNPECMQIMLDELYVLYKDKGITKIVVTPHFNPITDDLEVFVEKRNQKVRVLREAVKQQGWDVLVHSLMNHTH